MQLLYKTTAAMAPTGSQWTIQFLPLYLQIATNLFKQCSQTDHKLKNSDCSEKYRYQMKQNHAGVTISLGIGHF